MPLLLAAIALAAGIAAAVHYGAAGLSLAHFDARAHLVVARRILDSLSPGWQQIGAVWLPLPHVLNALPVQVDAWYRSGVSGTALSVISMAVAVWALARVIVAATGSASAAAAGAALLLLNPNVLYLQSTPMTEPLLFGTCLLAVACTARWVDRGAPLPARAPGWAIVAACMTRYEAWPICAALVALAGAALVRRGMPAAGALRACARLAAYPAVAILLFSANSRWTTGTWFLTSDFYVAENEAMGRATLALDQVIESAGILSGSAWIWPAFAGGALAVLAFVRSRERAGLILVLALAAAALIPWVAYYQGHPVRVRYGVPLVAACAAAAAAGIGVLAPRLRPVAAAAVVAWAVVQSPPLASDTPLLREAQRDAANRLGRGTVSAYLAAHWDGTPVMMSMGSLAHYMHDLALQGMDIRDFLHEGNGELWQYAEAAGPGGLVGWVAVEEDAEGGDALSRAAAANPQFLAGFDRVAEGGGVALYRAR